MEKDDRPLYSPAPEYLQEVKNAVVDKVGKFVAETYQEALSKAPEDYPKARAANDALSVVNQALTSGIVFTASLVADVKNKKDLPADVLIGIVLEDVVRRLKMLMEALDEK